MNGDDDDENNESGCTREVARRGSEGYMWLSIPSCHPKWLGELCDCVNVVGTTIIVFTTTLYVVGLARD